MEPSKFVKLAGACTLRFCTTALTALLATCAWTSQASAAQCLADAAGDPMLNCTANDFGVSSIDVTGLIDDGCQFIGDTVTFNANFSVLGGSPNRYDVGFWIGNDGLQAYTGQCSVAVIPTGGGLPDFDGDQCGDYGGASIVVPLTSITSACVDTDDDGFFDLAVCTSWDNNTSPDCLGVDDLEPATKSKCNCQQINTDLPTPHCATNADCPTDNNPCTNEVCNSRESGLGDDFGCSHNNNSVPCNDGLFCTNIDTCSGGTCVGTGNPCTTGPECNNTCNETNDNCATPAGTPCTADSNPCTLDRCNGSGSCTHPAGNAGAVCRSANGICDVQETCTGSTTACPANAFAPTTLTCRSASGMCDVAEQCSGTAASCPINGFAGTRTLCRESTSVCDVLETCSGTSASCPADGFASSSTVCRTSAGACDVQENCTGASAACPGNTFVVAATVCRAASDVCDTDEVCDGSTAACPDNEFAAETIVCRTSAGVCDTQETCSGTGASCPTDSFVQGESVCRDSAGICDQQEVCSGSTADCPPDTKLGAETTCRAAATVCDSTEVCDGSLAGCPADTFAESSTVCRAKAGDCDVQETCTGDSAACPGDTLESAATVCRAKADVCDTAENCTGTTADCPDNGFASEATVCRAVAGVCDVQETCTGAAAECPQDAWSGTNTVCRVAVSVCDIDEVCQGSGADCPEDSVASEVTLCRASVDVCDLDESCTGASTVCPPDTFRDTATVCRPADGVCDVAESCTGTGAACPAESFAMSTTVCRSTTGVCDVEETCTGSAAACPDEGFADTSVLCRATAGICDTPENCAGTAAACPDDSYLPTSTVCRAAAGECDLDENCSGDGVACGENLFKPAETTCSTDDNVCTDDECDGAGTCEHNANTVSCDDGLFCTGTDICADKVCGHTGDPCEGTDGDGDCSETCDEDADDCDGADPDGTICDDGLFCNGGPDKCIDGLCDDHPGFPCDDGEFCTDDLCIEETDMCQSDPIANGTPCDDDDICSLEDGCVDGMCVGEPTALKDLCPWIAVERQGIKRDTLKVGSKADVGGDVCGGIVRIGNLTIIDGDTASGHSSGPKSIRLSPDTFTTEDVVTDGAGVKARPGVGKLPQLEPPVSSLPPGSITMKTDATGFYHLSGAHPLADDCVLARNVYPDVIALLDGLPNDQTFGRVRPKSFQTQLFTAGAPGTVNVIDIVQVKTGRNVTLQLDGGGNANTVMVLRVEKKFAMKHHSVISLTGGLLPENTLIYVQGKKCTFGDLMDGKGTVLCANGRLKTGRTVSWLGTLYGAGRILKVGDTNILTYLPFTGF